MLYRDKFPTYPYSTIRNALPTPQTFSPPSSLQFVTIEARARSSPLTRTHWIKFFPLVKKISFLFSSFLLFSFDFFPHRMQAYLSTIHNLGVHCWRDESTVKSTGCFEREAEQFTHTSLQGALPSANQLCINSKKQHEIAYSLRGGRKRGGHLTNLNCRLCFYCAGNC